MIFILLGSFFTRIFLMLVLKTYAHPRLFEYEPIINNILAGKGFVVGMYKSFNNPLYSYLSAFIYSFTHHYAAMIVVHSLVSVLLAVVIYKIGEYLFDKRVGLVSALIVAFHPALVYHDIYTMIPLSIDILFLSLAVFLFLKNKVLLTGLCIGAGIYSRSMIGSLLPMFGLYLLFKRSFKGAIILFISAFLVVSPWLIRNYVIYKKVLFMSSSGLSLWYGNNERSTGTGIAKDGTPLLHLWPKEFVDKVESMTELEQKAFFEKEAYNYIRRNPLKTVKNYFKKLYYFVWFSPQSGFLYNKAYFKIYQCCYAILLIFATAGFVRNFRSAHIILLAILAIGMLQGLFIIEGRHRLLIEPLLIIMACSNMAKIERKE